MDELDELRLALRLSLRVLRKLERGEAAPLPETIAKLAEIQKAARRRSDFKSRAGVKSGRKLKSGMP